MKRIYFSAVILFCMMQLNAATFTLGPTYAIQEENVLQWIERKLNELKNNHVLEKLNQQLQEKILHHIESPSLINGITKTLKYRRYEYNPSMTLSEDIYDNVHHLIAKAGTIINPFDHLSLSHDLVIFDATDRDQITWAKKITQKNKKPVHWILVAGNWKNLSEQFDRKVFFDQRGLLVKKLKIEHVPAFITQLHDRLIIEEQIP